MVVLKVFNVDENDFEKPLSTFEVGEHVLGRGSFANCGDKKISRKHIILNVKDNEATLTLVHINPIFFMSKNSPHMEIIKQDNSIVLSDGDKFAFLIDTWYTIKIEENKKDNNNTEESSTSAVPLSNSINANKVVASKSNTVVASRSNTIVTQSASCKRGIDESYSEERKKLKLHNESLDKLKDNIDKIVSLDYQSNTTDGDQGTTSEVTTEVFKGKDISDSDDEDSDVEMLPEVTHDIEIINNVQDSLDENSDSHGTEDGAKKSEILEDLKKEPRIDYAEKTEIKSEPREEESNVDNNNTPEDSVGAELSRVVKNEDDPVVEIPDNNEIAKVDGQGPADASASSSGTSNRVKRDKCWYGQNCYRKNPGHKDQFTHPGDSDHEEDTDDDRPQCPYGFQCYRRNPQHRKDFKHPTSRPAAGPSTSNMKKRKRNSNTQTITDYDSDDSLDEGDPFSADESSSASEFVEDGDSDSDYMEETNADDMDDSGEMKNMLKEAQKFLKRKR